jgi:coproporphyrinogen III oxidase-like Fe-S oxidoreductase
MDKILFNALAESLKSSGFYIVDMQDIKCVDLYITSDLCINRVKYCDFNSYHFQMFSKSLREEDGLFDDFADAVDNCLVSYFRTIKIQNFLKEN